jgi:hypothetical protein
VFSGGTANGVPYLNASKVFTTGSALVFDGTNFGIGTSSPAAKLHVAVAGDNETTIARFGTTSTGSVTSQLKVLSDPSTNTVKFDATGSSSQNYSFMSGGTERVRIESSGSVGIGTGGNANGRLSVYETTVARLYLTDSTLGTTYGGQVRGYGVGGAGGYLELGVIDANVYNSAIKVYNQATQISLYTNSGTNGSTAERVRIDTNGNVVIGSANPYNATTDKLTVIKAQSALTQVFIDNQSSNPAAGASLVLSAYGGGTTFSVPSATPGYNPFIISVNGTERMRITSAGYVGLGTNDPQSLLTINSGGTDSLANTTINQTTDFAATSRAGFSGLTNNNGGFYFGMGANGTGIPAGFGFFREASGWNTAIAFYTNNQTSGTYSTRAMQEKMRLTSAGNLGIGTASPVANLTVVGSTLLNGTAIGLNDANPSYGGISFGFDGGPNLAQIVAVNASTSSLGFYTKASGAVPSERMRIDAAGYVGIGTTAPAAKLHVQHAGTTAITVKSTSTSGGAALNLDTGSGSGYSSQIAFAKDGTTVWALGGKDIGSASGDRFSLYNYSAGANFFTVDTSGKVGIGTVSPTAKLEVKMAADGDIFIGRYSGGSAKLVYAYQASSDGYLELRTGADDIVTKLSGYGGTASYFMSKVGIGTTTPSERLQVNGNISADALYLANANARLHFYTYQLGPAYSYAHLKTDAPWENHTQMYSVAITGHEYGASKPINAQVVWYSYQPVAGVVSVGSSGSHTIELYRSTDGYVVIRVNLPSGYYTGFTMSQYTTNQGLRPLSILGSAGSSSSNYY